MFGEVGDRIARGVLFVNFLEIVMLEFEPGVRVSMVDFPRSPRSRYTNLFYILEPTALSNDSHPEISKTRANRILPSHLTQCP